VGEAGVPDYFVDLPNLTVSSPDENKKNVTSGRVLFVVGVVDSNKTGAVVRACPVVSRL
jgi:hypothetical protein